MKQATLALAALALLVGGVGEAKASFLTITNAGFEDPPISTYNNGPITGWTISGRGAGVWNINADPLGFWNVPAPEGNQIAFVSTASAPGSLASISQTLTDNLQANTSYTLTGEVGHPI